MNLRKPGWVAGKVAWMEVLKDGEASQGRAEMLAVRGGREGVKYQRA